MNTSVRDFELFYNSLMQSAPKGYVPWLFPVKANGKDPDALAIGMRAGTKSGCCNADWIKVQRGKYPKTMCSKCGTGKGSWKAPWAKLTKEEVVQRLKEGKNYGISARKDDPLVIIDKDTLEAEEPKETLTVTSRKRIGKHFFFFTIDERCKQTIPTGTLGELRSKDAYVVGAGSYCEVIQNE